MDLLVQNLLVHLVRCRWEVVLILFQCTETAFLLELLVAYSNLLRSWCNFSELSHKCTLHSLARFSRDEQTKNKTLSIESSIVSIHAARKNVDKYKCLNKQNICHRNIEWSGERLATLCSWETQCRLKNVTSHMWFILRLSRMDPYLWDRAHDLALSAVNKVR